MLPANPLLNATAPAGPHLPVALLRQYAAGTLALAAQHRVEAHTLACSRCADILAGLLQTPAATTDQALAQLQQRLRQRVQQQAAPARLGRTPRRHRWVAPQLAAAAALLFGLLAGGWWTWQQRYLAPTASRHTAAIVPAAAPAPMAAGVPPNAAAPTVASPAASVVSLRPAARRGAVAVGHFTRHPLAKLPAKTATVAKPILLADALDKAVYDNVARRSVISATLPAAPVVSRPVPVLTDSVVLAEHTSSLALRSSQEGVAKVRASAMPAAPGLPPTPLGGYPAWREQLRREATEFKPEPPDRPLSGTVQLGVTIGADGKIQGMKVLHGLRADYDAEAQRLVCEGPKWVPGVSGGQRATRLVTVAVPF